MTEVDIDKMIHPEEARSRVLEMARPLPVETVHLTDAGDRILASDLVADVDLPPFRASTMDGYAVVHDDADPERRVIGSGFAGEYHDLQITPGTVTKIMTGAPVPEGATAVVMVENTEDFGGSVRINQSVVSAGENIRPVGSDMRAGDLLVPAGARLGPAEIGLLASLGHASVQVGSRPRVAVMSTGDELVEPAETPGPGQIRDSNRFSLSLAVRRAGGDLVLSRHVPDNEGSMRDAFEEALRVADVIVTSGGVSMGDRDLVKALLGEFADVHFRRVFMKPGKPLNFATAGSTLLFGLSGNPVSSLVAFEYFVRPALLRLQSGTAVDQNIVTVVTDSETQPSDRIEFQRALVWVGADGRLSARHTGSQSSARLASFLGANALLIVPPGDQTIPPGTSLQALLLDVPFAGEQH